MRSTINKLRVRTFPSSPVMLDTRVEPARNSRSSEEAMSKIDRDALDDLMDEVFSKSPEQSLKELDADDLVCVWRVKEKLFSDIQETPKPSCMRLIPEPAPVTMAMEIAEKTSEYCVFACLRAPQPHPKNNTWEVRWSRKTNADESWYQVLVSVVAEPHAGPSGRRYDLGEALSWAMREKTFGLLQFDTQLSVCAKLPQLPLLSPLPQGLPGNHFGIGFSLTPPPAPEQAGLSKPILKSSVKHQAH